MNFKFRAWTGYAAAAALLLLAGCCFLLEQDIEFQYQEKNNLGTIQENLPPYPEARFIVLADPHYYHPDLGTKGPEFRNYVETDRKMLALSDEILDAAAKRIRKEHADFILICGDMTKDGSLISHKEVSKKIGRLHSKAPVYVIPGNHDVANPHAFSYSPDGKERVPSAGPGEFRKIYAHYGYKQALAEDSSSLSYVVEPVPGLWVLALDSCLWRENEPGGAPRVDGRFTAETLRWMEEMLIKAVQRQKAVVAMMHHGLVEHYPSNEEHYGEYVVDGSRRAAELLASYGAKLVFTGHFHAQDITVERRDDPSRFVFDVETGSLITYPCPYRLVKISRSRDCTIKSRFIDSIPSMGGDFAGYAKSFTYSGAAGLADAELKKYRIPKQDRKKLVPQIADAYLAHLAGDEKKPDTIINTKGLGFMGRLVVFFEKDLVEGWLTDLPPPDNELCINLEDGSWSRLH